jgi:hypothetical protein
LYIAAGRPGIALSGGTTAVEEGAVVEVGGTEVVGVGPVVVEVGGLVVAGGVVSLPHPARKRLATMMIAKAKNNIFFILSFHSLFIQSNRFSKNKE